MYDSAMLPKINYMSMFMDQDPDMSNHVDSLAIKYLSDEQLSQLANVRIKSPVSDVFMFIDPCCCCLPSPLTLAIGGSPVFPLKDHQPASLASSSVTPTGSVHKSSGDNIVRYVGIVEEVLCV